MMSADEPKDVSPHPAGQDVPGLDVAKLLGQSRELRLRHGQQEYRLRLTRNGKLILTK